VKLACLDCGGRAGMLISRQMAFHMRNPICKPPEQPVYGGMEVQVIPAVHVQGLRPHFPIPFHF
jgi:hypothetical protein